jgi:hypothetical protein
VDKNSSRKPEWWYLNKTDKYGVVVSVMKFPDRRQAEELRLRLGLKHKDMDIYWVSQKEGGHRVTR